MNIAVFIKSTTFHKGYGGLETQNKMLCEGLISRGHRVTVFSPKKDVTFNDTIENGVIYYFVDSVYGTVKQWVSSKGWYKKSYEIFLSLHEKNKFDIVIGQSSSAIGIIRHKKLLNIPIISISHGSILSEFITRYSNLSGIGSVVKLIPDTVFTLYNFFFRQREFIHGSDRVICVSAYVKDTLIGECIAEPRKFVVIHNGVDPSKFIVSPGVGEDVKTVNVLWVGQVIKEKGADLLCKIFKDSRLSNIKLTVAGSGDYENTLKEQIKSNALDNRIYLVGKKRFEELVSLYNSSDIFIFPTNRIEGFPMVLVEAMLSGLPIVAFNLGGTSDAVVDGQTGYSVSPTEITTFTDRLVELVEKPELRKTFGENAKKIALNNFTLDNMIDQYDKILLEVIKK